MAELVNQKSFKETIQSTIEFSNVTFTASATSSVFDCGGATVIGVLPLTGYTGTKLTPQWSMDGITFYNVKDIRGDAVTPISATVNSFTALLTTDLLAFRYIRFVSDQTETCTVTLTTRRVA